jgi:uncharacterized membrane protein
MRREPRRGGCSRGSRSTGRGGSLQRQQKGSRKTLPGCFAICLAGFQGLIFLLIDKRPFVRFHGAQSIALNIAFCAIWVAFWIVTLLLGFITALMKFPIGFLTIFLYPVVMIGFFIVWVYCMYKAYQREKFKLPIIGNIVEGMVK